MFRTFIYYTYHTIDTYYTHIGYYAIGTTSIKGKVIVFLVD